jgi:hypothetical protein
VYRYSCNVGEGEVWRRASSFHPDHWACEVSVSHFSWNTERQAYASAKARSRWMSSVRSNGRSSTLRLRTTITGGTWAEEPVQHVWRCLQGIVSLASQISGEWGARIRHGRNTTVWHVSSFYSVVSCELASVHIFRAQIFPLYNYTYFWLAHFMAC